MRMQERHVTSGQPRMRHFRRSTAIITVFTPTLNPHPASFAPFNIDGIRRGVVIPAKLIPIFRVRSVEVKGHPVFGCSQHAVPSL